jgi:glycosyltransferase involved in cell wall biosynthesis
LLICTSSPDRCITGLLLALPKIREKFPDAEIHWAYGFKAGQGTGLLNDPRKEVQDWVSKTQDLMKKTEGFHDLGRLSQKEVKELYKKAEYYIYGTKFPEIDCISLTKAMACGCTPLVTPSGAMAEKIGLPESECSILHSLDYSLTEGPEFNAWVADIIEKMTLRNFSEKSTIYNNYSWTNVSDKWIKLLR